MHARLRGSNAARMGENAHRGNGAGRHFAIFADIERHVGEPRIIVVGEHHLGMSAHELVGQGEQFRPSAIAASSKLAHPSLIANERDGSVFGDAKVDGPLKGDQSTPARRSPGASDRSQARLAQSKQR